MVYRGSWNHFFSLLLENIPGKSLKANPWTEHKQNPLRHVLKIHVLMGKKVFKGPPVPFTAFKHKE